MRYCSKPKTRICLFLGLPCGPVVQTPLCNAGDAGSIPGQDLRSHVPWSSYAGAWAHRSLRPPSLSPQQESEPQRKVAQATANTCYKAERIDWGSFQKGFAFFLREKKMPLISKNNWKERTIVLRAQAFSSFHSPSELRWRPAFPLALGHRPLASLFKCQVLSFCV